MEVHDNKHYKHNQEGEFKKQFIEIFFISLSILVFLVIFNNSFKKKKCTQILRNNPSS